jgi:hypothetical protein
MNSAKTTEKLGLELFLQRPATEEAQRIPVTRDDAGRPLYPELDADGDHVHFEMVPMDGDSILWLTLRRGITPGLAATSLRKLANLIERYGLEVLQLPEGDKGSIGKHGELIPGPLRLDYDENGDLIIPSTVKNP